MVCKKVTEETAVIVAVFAKVFVIVLVSVRVEVGMKAFAVIVTFGAINNFASLGDKSCLTYNVWENSSGLWVEGEMVVVGEGGIVEWQCSKFGELCCVKYLLALLRLNPLLGS